MRHLLRQGGTISTEGIAFPILGLLVTVVMLLGGSARPDVASLLVIRPVALLALALGLFTIKWEHIAARKSILLISLSVMLLPLLQLVPLPPAVWTKLGGREILGDIGLLGGQGFVWRPITMTPFETRNALFSLSVPLAVIVLGVQISAREMQNLVYLVLAVGLISGLLGVLQILSAPATGLYFYRITNIGSPVGLFANRNHQAFLLASILPLLAYVATRAERAQKLQWLLSSLAGLTLLPLILITGSRSGLLLSGIALVAMPIFLLARAGLRVGGRSSKLPGWSQWALVVTALMLVIATIVLDRAQAWERLGNVDPQEEMRVRILPVLWQMITIYWPTGSGMGSFERIFQLHEPDALLDPSYMNHAHNDWLELLLTAGLPGVLLIMVGCVAFLVQFRVAFQHADPKLGDILLVRLGLLVILLSAVASLSDYPLRTPCAAGLFALAILWAGAAGSNNHWRPVVGPVRRGKSPEVKP